MNVVKFGNLEYKYESVFRDNKSKPVYDYRDKLFPYPAEGKGWGGKSLFLNKLSDVQIYLDEEKKIIDQKKKICKLNPEHGMITTKLYSLNGIRWEDSLYHYIDVHNLKPSDEFIEVIYRFIRPKPKNKITRIKAQIDPDLKHMKIERNQMLIIDSLMEHGSNKNYRDKKDKKVYRYSEHMGMLDFDDAKLERIIVMTNTERVDEDDGDIFMPQDIDYKSDWEFVFHTHPPTNGIGGRAVDGVLYEFPSMGDMYHFIDHYNNKKIQGSMILAPEGLYVIRKYKIDKTKINIDENKFDKMMNSIFEKVQDESIRKYGYPEKLNYKNGMTNKKFNDNFFYSIIAQDLSHINNVNKVLNKFEMHIDYFPREKDNRGEWTIDNIYIPVFPIE